MNVENLNRTADQLAELVGGYNRTTLFGGLAASFLGGSFLGALFGWLFFVLLLAISLIVGGIVGYMLLRSAGGLAGLRGQSAAQPAPGSSQQAPPAPQQPPSVPQQADPPASAPSPPPSPQQTTPAPPPPPAAPAPAGLSDLEQQIMERLVQSNGNLSISALAGELGVSGETIQQTVEGLANRGVITLG